VPKVVLLDPELTLSLPPDITAATGMDALCQLIEAYTCKSPNPFTDCLCREGLTRAARSLRKVFFEGTDLDAREDMVLASHFSGVALANAKLGAVHGFAAPLGGMVEATHGALCAALLPVVTAANLKALRERDPDSEALGRYDGVARILTGRSDAVGDDAALFCEALRRDMGIPRLREQGVKKEEFALACGKAAKASSMKGNPVELTMEELEQILITAY
jgi:alcohol dehydrogenase class IV